MNVREQIEHLLGTRYMASELSRADCSFLLALHDVCSQHGLSIEVDQGDGYGEARIVITTYDRELQKALAFAKRGSGY